MGTGPLSPRKPTRGHADCLPRAIRPRCTPRGGAVLLTYSRSRGTPGRVHDPVLPSGKATVVVHQLPSARVARRSNACQEGRCDRTRLRRSVGAGCTAGGLSVSWARLTPNPARGTKELGDTQDTVDRPGQVGSVGAARHSPRDPYTLSGRGAGEGGHMSKYFVQVGYTAKAWAAMSRGPQRVVERVQASAEALGGSIESLYFCFGDYDLMGVVDFPDSRRVAAWSMAVSSGGDVRAFKTTTLLSIEEGLHALGRASQATRAAQLPDAPV
jgi:uncharacterized protein with GYD domain